MSVAFVLGIHYWPVNSPHKGPVTRKMFPFDDIIMEIRVWIHKLHPCLNVGIWLHIHSLTSQWWFSLTTFEVRTWMSNYTSHKSMDVINYPYPNLSWINLAKGWHVSHYQILAMLYSWGLRVKEDILVEGLLDWFEVDCNWIICH